MNKSPKTVFRTRSKKWFLLFLLCFIFLQGKMTAQGCECVGCQGPIPISSTNTYTLNISGATNNDLSNAGQGICGIYLDVSFEHIWSLTITLTSPSGQSITLMGPYDNFPSTTGFSNWDISFLPCGDPVLPDPMASGGFFSDQWTNLQQWAFFTNYTGSYYPYFGCLEDFNSGTVNGDWTITVTNGSSVYDDGNFNGFSIQFCDDTGMGCTACDANAGDLSVVNDIDLCIGENYNGSIAPFYSFGSEPNNQYDYTYIISQSSIIESYEMTPDFSTFSEGTYEVCGLSYLSSDVLLIPPPNGTLSTSDLEMIMTSTAPFCGDISDDCFLVTVYPIPDTTFVSDEFCKGDTYSFSGNVYSSAGVYYPVLPALVGCDTIVELTLSELEIFSQNISETICEGDTLFVENFFHTNTGIFSDTLTTIFGCDSIINLELTVLNPQVNFTTPDTIICSNPEIQLNASNSTEGTGVSYLWFTNDGNITGGVLDDTTMVDAGGKYYFTVTQVNSGVVCTVIDSIQVIADLVAPTVSVAMDSMINCSVTTVVLDGSGTSTGSEFSYEWTTAGGNILQDTFTLSPTVNSGGTYILNVTNNNNDCLAQDSVLILQNTSFPSASAGADMEINCANPIIQLDGASSSQGNAYVYLWTTSDGNILLGNDGLQPTVDSAGTYQLTVTDTFSHCVTIDFVDITIDTLLPIADAGNQFTVNCFTPEVQIDATNSSQGGQFSYQWNALAGGPVMAGLTTLMPTINIGGVYELVVTNDLTGCSSSSQVVVNQDFITPGIVVNSPIDTITCLQNTIIIDASNSATGAIFEYEWMVIGSGNILADTFTLLPQIDLEGMYQLEITNTFNGCNSVDTVEVFANDTLPTSEAGANMTVDCNTPEVILDGAGSVGLEFEYLWTATNGGNILNGGTTFSPTVNGDGDYELLITNTLSGCTQTDIVSVNVDTIPPIAGAGVDTLIDCYNNTITLNGGNSSLGDFNYLWSTSNGTIDLGEATLQPTISVGGDYEILVTNNQNGCSAFDSVFVGENLIDPISIAGQDTIITCTNPSILLNGIGSSVGSDFSYQWTATNGGNISLNPNSLQPEIINAGNYQLVVTNIINGCTSMDEVIVLADTDFPTVEAGQNMTVDCNQLEVILNGSGSVGLEFEYLWTAMNGGNILNGETTLLPTVNGDGDYELLVTNTVSGCSQTDLVLVNVDTIPPMAAAGVDTLIDCNNNTITLNGGNSSLGGFSYLWSTSDGEIDFGETTLQPTISEGGNYEILVTNNQNGCSAFDSVFIGENFIAPISLAGQDTFVTCTNPTILLNGNGTSVGGNFSYQWTAINGGNISANPDSLQPEITTAGNYQLIVTNTDNGCTSMDEVVVAADTNLPIADAGSLDTLTCNQIVINLDGSSSSSGINIIYLWTTVDGNIVFGENSLTPQVDSSGNYMLTVSDTISGCSTQSSVEIAIDTLAPIADAGVSMELNCVDQSVLLDGTNSSMGNDLSYEWTTNGGNIFSNQDSLQPTVNQLGMYYLEVTNDINGCIAKDSVFVSQDITSPISIAGMDTLITCKNMTLILDGSGSSFGTNYIYQWTATNGGMIDNNDTSLQPQISASGNYELVVIDTTNGCFATDFLIVGININPPTANAGSPDVIDCNQSILTLDGSLSSMGSIYEYEWTTGNGNILSGENILSPQIDSTGTYVLEVTNTQNGCTNLSIVTITADTILPFADAGIDTMITCESNVINLNGTNSSTGNFSYNWTTTGLGTIVNENTIIPEINDSGTYQLEVTNIQNGCISIDETEVVFDTIAPIADAGSNGNLDCDSTSLTLGGNSSVGVSFEYQWSYAGGGNILTDSTLSTITVNAGATYNLLVINILNNCTATDEVIISQDANLPLAITNTMDTILCDSTQVILDGNGSSIGNDFSYNWTTIDGNIIANANTLFPIVDSVGLYTLTVTNTTNNCEATSFVNVVLKDCGPIALAGADGQVDCNLTTIVLDGTESSVGVEFTYLWTTIDGVILSDTTTLIPTVGSSGTYVLTVENTLYGSIATDTVFVEDLAILPSVDLSVNTLLNCVDTTVFVDGSNSSSGNSFLYSWSTNDGNIVADIGGDSILVDESGFYILEITNTLNGCVSIDSIEVFQNIDVPISDAGIAVDLNCYNSTITLDGSASSMGNNFTYEWTTGDGNIVSGFGGTQPLIDKDGTYDLLVMNIENGCTATSSVLIGIDTILPIVDVGFSVDLTCVDTMLFLNGLGSSMGNNFTYEWTTGDGNIIGDNTTLSPQIDEAGTYELSILNTQNFCEASSQILIEIDTVAPTILIEPAEVLNCDLTEFELDANASSFGNNFNIQWQTSDGNIVNGANSLSPQIDDGGDYELTILNIQNGCSTSELITVFQDTLIPVSDAGNTMELTCIDTVFTLDGSNSSSGNDFSYLWQTSNGNIESGVNSLFPSINLVGDYELVVMNNNNMCTSVSQVQITQDITEPIAIVNLPDTLNCENGMTGLSAINSSNGVVYSYLWSTSNGNIDFGGTSLTPQVSDGGQYVLEVTNDENGCTASDFIEVMQDTILPISEAGMTMTLTCLNTDLVLSGNGSSEGNEFTYEWTTNVGNFVNGTNTLNPQINELGIYQLEVTNNNNMCTSSDLVEVLEDVVSPEIEINTIGGLILNCNVSSIVLDASGSIPIGNVSFEWSTVNGNIITGNTDPNPEVNLEGDYQLILTNEMNGCTAIEMIQIMSDFELPIVQILVPDTLTCLDTLITVSGSGSSIGNEFEYLWTHTLGNIVSGETELECTVDEFGGYILTVLNTENGCMASEAITVYQNIEEPFADAGGNYEFDCIQTVKMLEGDGSQGFEFTYLWTTVDGNIMVGATNLQPIVDAFGSYVLTVTNQINGCIATSVAIVTEDLDVPQDVELDIVSPLCFGDYNGSIEVTEVIGGEEPYLYSINGNTFTEYPLFSNLPAGNYSITIQDASGCEWNSMIEIYAPAEVMVDLGEDIYLELGESTVLQAMTNISSFDLDSMSWTNIDSLECEDCLEQEITPLYTSGYGVFLMNENGCVTEDEVIVYVNNKKRIFIPNAFSPNGDGYNDVFMIYGGLGIEEIENFQIFSRWGDLVFEKNNFQPNDPSTGWNGFFKGKKMNPAVFVFFAKIKYTNGETEIMKGDLFLK